MRSWAEFWKSKWEKLDIAFHKTSAHPYLIEHFSKIKSKAANTTVLVPLCGKSLDMVWLAKQGSKVVGVELSALACQSFFKENDLDYSTQVLGKITKYSSEQIDIYCGDLFELTKSMVPPISAVYDRAALIALPAELRTKYVSHLLTLTKRPLDYLLVTMDYPQEKADGPPFSVPPSEVRELYKGAEVTVLERKPEADFAKIRDKFRGLPVFESSYHIRIS